MPGAWEVPRSLLIGMPHKGFVTTEWALSLRNLSSPPGCMYSVSRGFSIDETRNILVEELLKSDCDWLLFLDTDVIVPPDIIMRLLAHRKPIMSALYYTRFPPIEPAMWVGEGDGKKSIGYVPGDIVEAQYVGMGACLIHRTVFEKISKPWFRWTQGFEENGVGEDFFFCKKARESGYHIYVDTAIVCKHEVMGQCDDRGFSVGTI